MVRGASRVMRKGYSSRVWFESRNQCLEAKVQGFEVKVRVGAKGTRLGGSTRRELDQERGSTKREARLGGSSTRREVDQEEARPPRGPTKLGLRISS